MYFDWEKSAFFWEWDIYHYLLATVLSLAFLSRFTAFAFFAGIFGFFLSLLPLWQWLDPAIFSPPLAHALIGVCDGSGRGGWPLLPWIGLPWLFLAYGKWLKRHAELKKWELFAWIPFLLLGVFTWGAYFSVSIGPGFYCFMFRQSPYLFWGHFLWIVFALRLSVLPATQKHLGQFSLLRWLSELRINRNFGLAYLAQLILLWLAREWLLPLLGPKSSFFLLALLLLPLTELFTRALMRFVIPAFTRH
jgi:hypothetical protein